MQTPNYKSSERNSKGQWVKGPRKRTVKERHKKCTKCLKVKPFSEFHYMKPKTPYSDPVRPRCKECRKSDSAQDYIVRGDFIRKQQADARHTMTEKQRQQERDRIRNWEKANPERVKASAKKYREGTGRPTRYEAYQRRRALLANAPCDGHTTKELHAHWLHHGFDPKICSYCDASITAKVSVGDHVIPLSKGGDHMMDNLVPCCTSCNSSKGDKILYEEWAPPKDRVLQ